MSKYLILDDDPTRHYIFSRKLVGHQLTHVFNPPDAIVALSSESFDAIYLDYDLNFTVNCIEHKGIVVACFIAGMTNKPQKIVLHTMSTVGAHQMYKVLKKAGIACEIKHFDEHFLDMPCFYINTTLHSYQLPCISCGATEEKDHANIQVPSVRT